MNKPNLTNAWKSVRTFTSKHSPEILTGLGIAGMVTTTILAVKGTPKALKLIEMKKEEDGVDELTAVDVVKTTWKCYIPAVVTGTASIACLIGASSVSARRNAALATAYKLSETALTEYREKVVETIGEKKEQAIKEQVDKERLEKNPVSKNEVIITEKGNTLCYDYQSGRYFKSDIEKIKKAINEINRQMLLYDYVSLNEFYDELGLERTPMGDDLGWRVDRGYIEPRFSSHIADDGTPCIVLNYEVAPQHDYSRYS
jgi:hypothetical protein